MGRVELARLLLLFYAMLCVLGFEFVWEKK
jgi:hypothetical protein